MDKRLIALVLPILFLSSLLLSQTQNDADEVKDKADEVKSPISKQHERLSQKQGRFSWKAQLDYTMGRPDPLTGEKGPKFISIIGESTSQMILGDRFLLTRTLTEGKKFKEYQIHGYRSDLNQYFFIGIESLRTPFGYRSGNYVGEDLILKDPLGYITEKSRFDSKKRITKSEVFLGESKTPFFVLNSEPKKGKMADLLAELRTARPIGKALNRSDQRDDTAENFSQEHLLLNKFAGNMVSDSEEIYPRVCRVICDGRFLISLSLKSVEANEVDRITLIGFDSSRQVFQLFQLSEESLNPTYLEGDFDGITLVFRNPFAGQLKDEPVISYTFAKKGSGFFETDQRLKDNKLASPVQFKPTKKFR